MNCPLCALANQPRNAPCTNCRYDGTAPNRGVENIVDKIISDGDLELSSLDIYVREMLPVVGSDQLAIFRFRCNIVTIFSYYKFADRTAEFIFMVPFPDRMTELCRLFRCFNDDSRNRPWLEGDAFGYANANKYIQSTSKNDLQAYLQSGWTNIEVFWTTINGNERRRFLDLVLIHDKGYPQSLTGMETFFAGQNFDIIAWLGKAVKPTFGNNTNSNEEAWAGFVGSAMAQASRSDLTQFCIEINSRSVDVANLFTGRDRLIADSFIPQTEALFKKHLL